MLSIGLKSSTGIYGDWVPPPTVEDGLACSRGWQQLNLWCSLQASGFARVGEKLDGWFSGAALLITSLWTWFFCLWHFAGMLCTTATGQQLQPT